MQYASEQKVYYVAKTYLWEFVPEHYIQTRIKCIFKHNLSIMRSQYHTSRAEELQIIQYIRKHPYSTIETGKANSV
jgi:hypothetical protein